MVFLMIAFYSISFTSSSISFWRSCHVTNWIEIFDWKKFSFERELHNHLLNTGYSDPWLIFSKLLKNVLIYLLIERLDLSL